MSERGAYKTKRKLAEPDLEAAFVSDCNWLQLRDKIIEESPLKSKAAKVAGANSLATLFIQQRYLTKRLGSNVITADELRQIPAVANQIGKLLTKLGIDEVHDEDMDFADL